MHKVKTAKMIFYFTVLLLFAKPFYGFTVFSRLKPPHQSNILIKIFSKRKQEFNEGSESDISTIQKNLANPVTNLFLRFSFFLAILFPFLFKKDSEITAGYLNNMQLSLIPAPRPYLLAGKLII